MATNRYPCGLGIGAIMLAVTVLGAMVTPAVAGLSLDSLINKAVKKLPVKPGTGQVKVSLRIKKERGPGLSHFLTQQRRTIGRGSRPHPLCDLGTTTRVDARPASPPVGGFGGVGVS